MMDLFSELPVDICDRQIHAALVLRGLPWDRARIFISVTGPVALVFSHIRLTNDISLVIKRIKLQATKTVFLLHVLYELINHSRWKSYILQELIYDLMCHRRREAEL